MPLLHCYLLYFLTLLSIIFRSFTALISVIFLNTVICYISFLYCTVPCYKPRLSYLSYYYESCVGFLSISENAIFASSFLVSLTDFFPYLHSLSFCFHHFISLVQSVFKLSEVSFMQPR